jgi:protein-L-isoaspartate(D-aspartate) O-methyltransferase
VSEAAAQATAEFLLRLRALGIHDLALLRAFETIPRRAFVPHRYRDLAGRDIALPIACGQTTSEPSLIARMLEAAALAPHHRVLEIGTGSGYATALLSRLAAQIVSFDRFRSLVLAAKARMAELYLSNCALVWADGLAPAAGIGNFDRIIVHASLAQTPSALAELLAADGIMVLACHRPDSSPRMILRGQRLVRLVRDSSGPLRAQDLGPARLARLIAGKSQEL